MTSREDIIYDCSLHHPGSFFLAGQSGSGKTSWVQRLIENKDFMFDKKIDKIIWCYAHWQEIFNDPIMKDVDFVKGLTLEPYVCKTTYSKIVVIDDLMVSASRNQDFVHTFTTNRHANVSTVFLSQNLFYSGFRTCSLNASYIVLMKMVRDKQQISSLLKQMYPGKLFREAKAAIDDATTDPYSYVLLDLTQTCPDKLRIRARIFPDEWLDEGYYGQHVYVPV